MEGAGVAHAPPERLGEAEALREKLDTARRQRLLNQKLSGKSLGEQLGGEELDSSAAWVAKSRRQAEERKDAAARKPKRKARPAGTSDRFDEMDEEVQGQSQVSGAQLSHSIDDFKAGEEVVLTLADQNVLDGDEVNDNDELLENVNLKLAAGAKVGVLGANGAGKSSFLRVLAGWDADVEGEHWIREGLKVGMLEQEPRLDDERVCHAIHRARTPD